MKLPVCFYTLSSVRVCVCVCFLQAAVISMIEATLETRSDNERVWQPFIHTTLLCAARLAEILTGNVFNVSNPSFVKGCNDQLSDEAVYENICDLKSDVVRIFLEIKGSEKIPHFLLGQRGEHIFSQMLQQVALVLRSGMWNHELLCGAATSTVWYLFEAQDVSPE